jgi:flagellar biogenesis protein FliO
MIAAAAVAVKKWGRKVRIAVGGGSETLQLLSRLAISPKQSVCLIRVGRQVVLVGVTPEQISPLTVIDDPEAIGELMTSSDESRELTGGFARLFSRATSSYEYEDDLTEDESAAELPMGTGDDHYRQARMELTGLLDKIRSRGRSAQTGPQRHGDERRREPIAIA